MCQCLTICYYWWCSYNAKGAVVKQIFLLNKNIVHLIDDIFWHLGFKTETQAEKVCTLYILLHLWHLLHLLHLYSLYELSPGTARSWSCRSRVAGQKGRNCWNRWCLGRSVSPCHARRMAFLHPTGLPGRRPSPSWPAGAARHVGAPWLSRFCLRKLRKLIPCVTGCLWPFFSMNARLFCKFVFRNNANNGTNKCYNSAIMAIIVTTQHSFGPPGVNASLRGVASPSSYTLNHRTQICRA